MSDSLLHQRSIRISRGLWKRRGFRPDIFAECVKYPISLAAANCWMTRPDSNWHLKDSKSFARPIMLRVNVLESGLIECFDCSIWAEVTLVVAANNQSKVEKRNVCCSTSELRIRRHGGIRTRDWPIISRSNSTLGC